MKMADACRPDPALEVVTPLPLEDTHDGTKEMTVRDPEGRLWTLQAPAGDETRREAEARG